MMVGGRSCVLRSRIGACRFGGQIQRGDAERQRIPPHIRQAMAPESIGEYFTVGKFANTGRKISIGIILAARDPLSDQRQDPLGIETKERTKESPTGLREFEDRHLASRARDPSDLCQAQVGISNVTQTKCDGGDLKLAVCKRQLLGVRLQEANAVSCLSPASFLLRS